MPLVKARKKEATDLMVVCVKLQEGQRWQGELGTRREGMHVKADKGHS